MLFAKRAFAEAAAWVLRLLMAYWFQENVYGIVKHCRHSCTPSECIFVSNTSSCEIEARPLFDFDFKQELPYIAPCPASQIRAFLFARIVQPKQYFPFVMLNVSTLVDLQEPTAVLVTFKCITSYGMLNEFCEQPRRPCRLIKWNAKMASMLSSVECFHMPPNSLIEVNVTVHFANCTLRYLVQSPYASQLQESTSFADWLPFVLVDPNADDDIVVNVSRPPSTIWLQGVLVEVWSREGDVFGLLYSKTAMFPDDSVRISNLAAGDYILRIHVLHPGCPKGRCRYQNFSLQLRRPYPALSVQSLSSPILLVVLTVLILLATFLLVILYMLKRQRKSRRQATVVRVNIQNLVKVFLLYSHDSEQYCDVVVALANVLKLDLACEVMLDEWALRDADTNPADWLAECMNKANFYLLLFSEGVGLLCNGMTPVDNVLRPWTDAWQAAVRSVCQKAVTSKSTGDHTPYICSTLSTTPLSVLPVCLTLPCWFRCRLPEELSALACHLHSLQQGVLDLSRSEAFKKLQQAISIYFQRRLAISSNSNGYECPTGRFDAWKQTGQTVSTLQEDVSDHEVDDEDDDTQIAFERYAETCKVYQLIPPDSAVDSQPQQKYSLLPPDADSGDEVENFHISPAACSTNEMTNRLLWFLHFFKRTLTDP
ncbi:SEFIR domain containing protein [Trichuris trichiura]|uniref:SEFIR domain containing protein n=1 Tax=Trichuris trichiura TaxID=36087 RepID=A0A077Z7X5_TRITR|nr:SEFIR domain containing protein [Trichuris trichiura]